jgi:hypothetical protein
MAKSPDGVHISIRQVLASVAGAVVAASIASFFGVSGTIVGVAIGSAAATIGTALAAQSIDRTHHAVRQVAVRAPDSSLLRRLGGTDAAGGVTESPHVAHVPVTEVAVSPHEARGEETAVTEVSTPGPRTAVLPPMAAGGRPRRLNWRVVAVTSVIVFVLVLLLITVVELLAGKPLSDVFGGQPGSGVSILGGSTGTTTTTHPASTTTTVPPTSTPTSTAGSTTSTTGASTTTSSVPTTTTVPTTSTTFGSSTSTSSAVPG